MKCECRGCQFRTLACHDTCPSYQKFKVGNQAEKDFLRKHKKTLNEMDFEVNILRGMK